MDTCQLVFKHLAVRTGLRQYITLKGRRILKFVIRAAGCVTSRLFHIMSNLKQRHSISQNIRSKIYPNSSRVIKVLTSIYDSEPAYAFCSSIDMNLMLGNLLFGINSLEQDIYPYGNTGNLLHEP